MDFRMPTPGREVGISVGFSVVPAASAARSPSGIFARFGVYGSMIRSVTLGNALLFAISLPEPGSPITDQERPPSLVFQVWPPAWLFVAESDGSTAIPVTRPVAAWPAA